MKRALPIITEFSTQQYNFIPYDEEMNTKKTKLIEYTGQVTISWIQCKKTNHNPYYTKLEWRLNGFSPIVSDFYVVGDIDLTTNFHIALQHLFPKDIWIYIYKLLVLHTMIERQNWIRGYVREKPGRFLTSTFFYVEKLINSHV